MQSIRILGTGSYVPPERLTNSDLENMGLDTTDEWIQKRTGVVERRIADPDVTASDLGYEASKKALEMAGLTAKDIDLIIVATITPDAGLTQTARDLGLVGDNGLGGPKAANAFWTDESGYGTFYAKLDYPLVKGAVQFQEYDATLARAAIGDAPFRLRIASHCADNMAHGLLPGFHEMWFDWM